MDFADRLCELMETNGVTNYRLSKEIGCTATTVANWLAGKDASKGYIQKIASYFGVSVDYLLGTEKEKAPTPEGEREIGMDDFTYAFYNESKDLPEEKKKMLLDMARFMKADIEKEKGK